MEFITQEKQLREAMAAQEQLIMVRLRRLGRRRGVRHILSRGLYGDGGGAGADTGRKGLDEEHNQQLVIQHIQNCGSKGATILEFQQVLPNKTGPQISALLKRMKAAKRSAR